MVTGLSLSLSLAFESGANTHIGHTGKSLVQSDDSGQQSKQFETINCEIHYIIYDIIKQTINILLFISKDVILLVRFVTISYPMMQGLKLCHVV